ncbi:hypothetical protein V5799_027193 [Amblyomma americanum]|uniref:Uncharacterized protein n=1 Tax=Amblyomma americanum TaxID=6943 RepID=A0AAQ4DGF0_AMBAM
MLLGKKGHDIFVPLIILCESPLASALLERRSSQGIKHRRRPQFIPPLFFAQNTSYGEAETMCSFCGVPARTLLDLYAGAIRQDYERALMKPPKLIFCLVISSLLFFCYITYKGKLSLTQAPRKDQLMRSYSRQTQQGARNTSPISNVVDGGDVGSLSHNSNVSETELIDACLEGNLPEAFKSALDVNPIIPPADVKIVLVLASYRSGSTFIGELLSSGPTTFFHFEPLQLFSESGRLRWGRQADAFQLLNKLVRCRMQEVPLYMVWLERRHEYKRNRFLADVCQGGKSCFCPRHVASLCLRSRTQVFKFTRLHFAQVAKWIESNPDIAESVRVIHLVRDPRAIYASRQGVKWCIRNPDCASAEALCSQMRSDLDAFEVLTGRKRPYPLHRLRFEDLAADPVNETSRLFGLLDIEFAPSTTEYLKAHTTSDDWDLWNPHSTWRNTSQVADRWKRKLRQDDIKVIERVCADVLRRLGYELLFNNTTSAHQRIAEEARRVPDVRTRH